MIEYYSKMVQFMVEKCLSHYSKNDGVHYSKMVDKIIK
jgi:hypothetical protein